MFKILFTSILLSAAGISPTQPEAHITLTGKVVCEKGRAPVPNVLVYIVEGEEEALTDARGKFSIETRKGFPLRVTAQQLVGKKQKVVVIAAADRLVIELPE
jgi:DNA polymerase IIIc chi subunit